MINNMYTYIYIYIDKYIQIYKSICKCKYEVSIMVLIKYIYFSMASWKRV